jgi:N-formylglutamate amidohydrolase
MLPYTIHEATTAEVPVIISVPHCGVGFPDEIRNEFKESLIQKPDDTDWFVDRLYDFAPSMGATMISAIYSRWVIDLNRDRDSKPLYSDGRIITALCPVTTFLGEPLYTDEREVVSESEVERRYVQYYKPYHDKLHDLLHQHIRRFGKVLLWDCHSIRQIVPTIQKDEFPDLILGDADGRSASAELIEIAFKSLGANVYSIHHNHPFKGGTITRTFGNPRHGQHALQLEMTKVNYMDDAEENYDPQRAEKMRTVLKYTFRNLIQILTNS